jgi:hypothetical protein
MPSYVRSYLRRRPRNLFIPSKPGAAGNNYTLTALRAR